MKSYLSLVSKYLSAHKKKTRLTLISVVISITLITGIFSMLEGFLQFEKLQIIHDYGNYHILVQDASEEERAAIAARPDVQNSGRWKEVGKAIINGQPCVLGAVDSNFAPNMNINVIEGSYPNEKNQIMLEQWALENFSPNLNVGDTVKLSLSDLPDLHQIKDKQDISSFPNNQESEFIISGVYNDLGNMKAQGVPGVLISTELAEKIAPDKTEFFLIEFKKKADIIRAEEEIKHNLNIAAERIGHNERLLAVIGQSTHEAAMGLYTIGGILFFIVLLAGVVMIYNTFNISVMERIRQFGLLRCIGASQSQIEKLVKREGLYITLAAIPIGILLGLLMTLVCSAILKFYNPGLFGLMPLFTFSLSGIGAGILVGFMTVFTAVFLPAKKAGRVSPVNAVTGSNEVKVSKKLKRGYLTRAFPVDVAMGINNALVKKKTLILMSCSIALSIIMFLGFQVFVDFMHSSLKTTKPYTPDISLTSEEGLSRSDIAKFAELDGVKEAYGRMFGYAKTTFKATRLTEEYKTMMDGIEVQENGLFVPAEKSWFISYDQNQFKWAKEDLINGVLDEKALDQQDGIITVVNNLRNNVSARTTDLQVGDKVYVETPAGTQELTVMGVLRSVPFSDSELNLATFITTEKLLSELTGETNFEVIDIQLQSKNQEQTVQAIKDMAGDKMTFYDSRQKNAEVDQAFLTMAVFIYGFVAVIALISILNIFNTMTTSIAAKTRYLGVMRAVGMSGTQLNRMVLAEAVTYSLIGCLTGSILGVILQKHLIQNSLSHFKVPWHFPTSQLILILVITLLVTVISVISPLRSIKEKGISEVLNSF